MLARSGDELQGMKRGIMEMANLIAITKADGDNVEAANQARAQFNSALHLYTLPESKWHPRVVTCSAIQNDGLKEIWEIINEYENIVFAHEIIENTWISANIETKHDLIPHERHLIEVISGDAKGTSINMIFEKIENGTKINADINIHLTGVLVIFGLIPVDQLNHAINTVFTQFEIDALSNNYSC